MPQREGAITTIESALSKYKLSKISTRNYKNVLPVFLNPQLAIVTFQTGSKPVSKLLQNIFFRHLKFLMILFKMFKMSHMTSNLVLKMANIINKTSSNDSKLDLPWHSVYFRYCQLFVNFDCLKFGWKTIDRTSSKKLKRFKLG